MFKHIYLYRIKCLLRNRNALFWSLLFPIVLALFFNLAFSNLASGESFKSIPVAVVSNAEYLSNTSFQQALKSVSDDNEASTDKLFHVSIESKEQAADDLKSGKVDGYILLDNGVHVVVKSSDTEQTIIKNFVDTYLQTASAYSSVLRNNPDAATSLASSATKDFITEVSPANASADDTSAYYYALIAMAVMFGGFWGKEEVEDIQADFSDVGARINLAPVHKLKAFVSSFCASVTIDFCCLLALFAFLTFAIGLKFGSQTGYIIMVCFFGSITGVSFGAFIAVVVKGSTHLKASVMVAVNLLTSCLAGLMSLNVKYTVTHALPFMAYINPANLISDALYSLNYYSSHTRYFINIGCLCALSIAFIMTVYFVIRRQKYASI